jgi:hypothetical protein
LKFPTLSEKLSAMLYDTISALHEGTMLQLNLPWARVLAEQALAYPSKVRNKDITFESLDDCLDEVKMPQQGGNVEHGAQQAAQKLAQRLSCMELKDKQLCSGRDSHRDPSTRRHHVAAEAAALHCKTRPDAGWSTPCNTPHSSGVSSSLATMFSAGSQLHYSRELRAAAEQLMGSQSLT